MTMTNLPVKLGKLWKETLNDEETLLETQTHGRTWIGGVDRMCERAGVVCMSGVC